MLPGIAYYLSRWYTKDELVFRLSLYSECQRVGSRFDESFLSHGGPITLEQSSVRPSPELSEVSSLQEF
jgi:hypothetical protein